VARAFAAAFDLVRADGADVVSQHGFDAEAFELAAGLPVLHTLHLGPIAPAVVDAARGSACAVPSEAMRRDWAAAGVDAAVLRNGSPDFDPGRPEVGAYAVIAGRVSPEKGTAHAIRAAHRAGLSPLVVGAVYDAAYHEREVGPLLAPGELLPVLRRELLWRVMSRATVTLMPIEWDEPFGLVAAEAQIAGCPVVAYARGALAEVVDDGVGGLLVPPGDFEAFVAAIPRAAALDRARVRRSARDRLLIEGAAERYERALGAVAR
jgi:glycosyltransferase involved in cell wall biosynthesis